LVGTWIVSYRVAILANHAAQVRKTMEAIGVAVGNPSSVASSSNDFKNLVVSRLLVEEATFDIASFRLEHFTAATENGSSASLHFQVDSKRAVTTQTMHQQVDRTRALAELSLFILAVVVTIQLGQI